MKKIKIVIVLLILLLIAGCQNTVNPTINNLEKDNIPDYTPAAEEVIDMHGEIENIERFQEFLNNVENLKKDSIRVVRYTEEGDPMLHDLEFDTEVIKSTQNTRRDKFGQGNIISTSCTSIEVVESTERTDYILEGCEDTMDNTVLVTWK